MLIFERRESCVKTMELNNTVYLEIKLNLKTILACLLILLNTYDDILLKLVLSIPATAADVKVDIAPLIRAEPASPEMSADRPGASCERTPIWVPSERT